MGILSWFKASTTVAQNLRLTDPRFTSWMIGGETDSGERVTVDAAMQLDVVWACVRRIAETIATLPLHFYTLNKSGSGEIDRTNPLYSILHDSPNADMTAVNFWEAMVGCYLLWGNAYALKSTGYLQRITALTPLRPDRTQLLRAPDGTITYRYTAFGQSETFSEDEIFHIKGFSLDGIIGMSPVGQARQSLGTARATQRAAAAMFKNGMRPSGVLVAPAYLTAPQRESTQPLIEKFSGAANTGMVPLLEGGWDFKQLSINPTDAQFLETQNFQVEQICRWFDVPPILVGHSAQTTWGSGIEQIMLGWLTLGLRSHLERIEQAIRKDLLSPADRVAGAYAEFNVDALLRGDSKSRAEMMATLALNGLRTRNELRSLDNFPPHPHGDDLTVNAALLPIGDLGIVAKLPKDKLVLPGASITDPNAGTADPGLSASLPSTANPGPKK
jgi:HK97 family phage portal protein